MPAPKFQDAYLGELKDWAKEFGLTISTANGGGFNLVKIGGEREKVLHWGTLPQIGIWLDGCSFGFYAPKAAK